MRETIEIASNCLLHRKSTSLSLFDGEAGDLILLRDLYRITGEARYLTIFQQETEDILSKINNVDSLAFGGGLCGILFSLSCVSDEYIIFGSDSDELEEIIWNAVENSFQRGDYDLQTGLIGYGLFYLEVSKSNPKFKRNVLLICDMLYNLFVEYNGYYFLPYRLETHPFFPDNNRWTNNGFLHGVNSVVAFFLACIENGLYIDLIVDLTHKLLHQEIECFSNSDLCFPMSYTIGEDGSLLLDKRGTGLCYCTGDYGIITNFFRAAAVFDNTNYLHCAQLSYDRITNRFIDGERNKNPFFCHGKSSIVYFSYRLAALNGCMPPLEIELERRDLTHIVKTVSSNSILEGANGILLALLSKFTESTLERALLLR